MHPRSGQPRAVVQMQKRRDSQPCRLHRAANRVSVLKRTVEAMTVAPIPQGYKPRQHTPTEAECERACTHVPKVRKLTSQDGCVTKSRSGDIVYTGRVRGGYKAYFIIVHIILTRSIMIRVSHTPILPKRPKTTEFILINVAIVVVMSVYISEIYTLVVSFSLIGANPFLRNDRLLASVWG